MQQFTIMDFSYVGIDQANCPVSNYRYHTVLLMIFGFISLFMTRSLLTKDTYISVSCYKLSFNPCLGRDNLTRASLNLGRVDLPFLCLLKEST